ncbi:MAG TPA: NAD(P)-dependent oxidoreductase [Drouetiella sp.]
MSKENRALKIAYLGLGIMGSAMTINLGKSGYAVVGWNRSMDRGGVYDVRLQDIKVVPDIADAVKDADVIFSCLGDVPDVKEVLLGPVKQHAKENAIVVDTTTIGRAAAIELKEKLAESGIRFLDAPVTGGDVGAKQGTLTILVGGARADFDEVLPILNNIGRNIVYCGESGSGQAMKLCNQVLCAINMIAVSETFALADEMGIDKKLILDSLGSGAGASWALSNLGARIAKGDFAPGFTLEHMLKDLRLIDENADDCQLPGVELAREYFNKAGKLGGAEGFRQGTQAMYRAYAATKSAT